MKKPEAPEPPKEYRSTDSMVDDLNAMSEYFVGVTAPGAVTVIEEVIGRLKQLEDRHKLLVYWLDQYQFGPDDMPLGGMICDYANYHHRHIYEEMTKEGRLAFVRQEQTDVTGTGLMRIARFYRIQPGQSIEEIRCKHCHQDLRQHEHKMSCESLENREMWVGGTVTNLADRRKR